MPNYIYTTDDGESFEKFRSIHASGLPRKSIRVSGGRIARRDFGGEAKGGRRMADPWPIHSDAMGCHPDQVKKLQKRLADAGVQTDFDGNSCPILRNNTHRNKVMRELGLCDLDAGYGQYNGR